MFFTDTPVRGLDGDHDHGGRYYPETPMSINFTLWFISGGLVGQPCQQRVDWVYVAENEVVSPAQVT